jgi:hypothetical protein
MLRAWPSLTIGEIKTMIEHSEGIHPSYQLLAFPGKQLEDGRSLSCECAALDFVFVRPK